MKRVIHKAVITSTGPFMESWGPKCHARFAIVPLALLARKWQDVTCRRCKRLDNRLK